eukprot:6211838-Pleurochrysis_carterae.AAC.3
MPACGWLCRARMRTWPCLRKHVIYCTSTWMRVLLHSSQACAWHARAACANRRVLSILMQSARRRKRPNTLLAP